MTSDPRLFCCDTVMVDVVLQVDSLPRAGGDTVAAQRVITAGGGFNVMSAAVRHGMAVTYAGQLGRGVLADLARTSLIEANIAVPVGPGSDEDVGFCVVLVEPSGERSFVTSPGAEKQLRLSDLNQLALAADDYLFLSGYNLVYPELGAVIVAWLATVPEGVVVAFDPGPRVLDISTPLLEAVLSRADWLLCNEVEARTLSGAGDVKSAAGALLLRCGGVVVHDGARGCVVATRDAVPTRVEGYRVVVVDTNGAGDTHDGVFLAELARGTDLVEAAQRANGACALAVSRLGLAACPTRDEVTRWLDEFGAGIRGELVRPGDPEPNVTST